MLVVVLMIMVLQIYEWQRMRAYTLVIKLKGRLGNQLFEVAAGEYLQARSGATEVRYLRNDYSLETDLSGGVLRELVHYDAIEEACRGRGMIGRYTERRYDCSEVGMRELQKGGCLVVDGFFQCPKMAKFGREKVRGLLERSEGYTRAKAGIGELRKQFAGRRVVGVHVRRGDYTKRFNKGLLEPLEVDYYRKAAGLFSRERIAYAVFSDDLEWCERELRGVLGGAMEIVRERDAVTSLLMMMLCDEFVIANSSFSWWAAFLGSDGDGGGRVVAPRRWFGHRVTQNVSIWPSDWVVLP